jgi:hypothetical protein
MFAFGSNSTNYWSNLKTLVDNSGSVSSESASAGTARFGGAGASYGTGLGLFGFGTAQDGSKSKAISTTNKVSNAGVMASDVDYGGTARTGLAAASYGGDKILFGFGNLLDNTKLDRFTFADNTGTIVSDTTNTGGTARTGLAAASYGGDKAVFAFGGFTNIITYIDNNGSVSSEVTNLSGSSVYGKTSLAAASYGKDKAIFAYGYRDNLGSSVNSSTKNLISNDGTIAATVSIAGYARHGLAAVGYDGDKAVFGFGATGSYLSMTNKVSSTGVVDADTTNNGYVGRDGISAAGYS